MKHVIVLGGKALEVGRVLLVFGFVFEREFICVFRSGSRAAPCTFVLLLILVVEREARCRVGAASHVVEAGNARG